MLFKGIDRYKGRKQNFNKNKSHEDVIKEAYGMDIREFEEHEWKLEQVIRRAIKRAELEGKERLMQLAQGEFDFEEDKLTDAEIDDHIERINKVLSDPEMSKQDKFIALLT